MAHRQEPFAASVAVVPPLGLPTIPVRPEIQVAGEIALVAPRCRPARRLVTVAEFQRFTRPTVRARDQVGHSLSSVRQAYWQLGLARPTLLSHQARCELVVGSTFARFRPG